MVGQTVQFNDISTGNPTSWQWTFEGGTPTTSTDQNPAVTYNSAGIFDVSLTVTNEDGQNTETKTGYITVIEIVEKTYILVTSTDEIEDGGKYLFVGIKNEINYALGWQKTSNRHAVPVEVTENTIKIIPAYSVTPTQDEIYPYEITIASEGDQWTLYDELHQKYLRPQTGTNNGLVVNVAKAFWDLSVENDGVVSLVCTGSEDDVTFDRNSLRFNQNNANTPLFACYASGQQDFQIYKSGTVSIDELRIENRELRVYTQNGTLYISGLTLGERWNVYTIAGVLIAEGGTPSNLQNAESKEISVSLPHSGIYIVTSGNKIAKVLF
jgi:PKD repeat protein